MDVAPDNKEPTVSAFQGSARVRSTRGDEVVINERQAIIASARGSISEKLEIPDSPFPVEPRNNAGFDVGRQEIIELIWRGRPVGGSVHLQVSRSKSFDTVSLDVDADHLARDRARLRLVTPGTYFWRVAALADTMVPSEWSVVRRFRVFSSSANHLLTDTTPPKLVVYPPQQLGRLFIFEGATEPSATLTINGEKVELDADGGFRKTVEVFQEGWSDIVIVAIDPSGNPTKRRERVFVEVY